MKKLILCASFVALGLMTSCEKELLIPEESKPAWLGGSIYEELRSGTHLTGTFNTYLRLIDDLGYNEILSRTGSKTIFPANDEAFDRFFKNNKYGVHSYEELTEGMKRQILKSSMLDNALLSGMLSNISKDDNNVERGVAIKHETNISLTDSITHLLGDSEMPQNNPYWDGYRQKGIHVVYDATKPMMVHFTREQMLKNTITTTGTDSDFGILRGEVQGTTITNSDTTYVYQTRIISQDVTCLNGYIHQVNDVLVPPGNIPQVLREEENTTLFSRIVDYFSAPYYDAATTRDYNSWALENGMPTIDSIFQVRYFTGGRSQKGEPNLLDPSSAIVPMEKRLEWDLGWNQYYSSTNADLSLADIGSILVPTDDAVREYFLPGGGGAYLIDLYGDLANNEENLPQNLDALHNKGNGILTSFVNNLIQTSFVATVPSKFGTIKNEGSGDFMGLTKNDISLTADNRYDVVVANNGVVYKMKSMIAPDELQSVIGPAITYPDMSVMGYFTKDKTNGSSAALFGADMYYYLMAMKANYLYFIPDNEALANCYIDPISLATLTPRAIEFYTYDEERDGRVNTMYGARLYHYDPETGVIDKSAPYSNVTNIINTDGKTSDYASQIYDMLNYNTVVLDAGEEIVNKYYLTKHGGAICLSNLGEVGSTVSGGAQIDNNAEPAMIEERWKEKNGWAFRLNNVIQPAITSVHKLLSNNEDQFSEFLDFCGTFDDSGLLDWAGIKTTAEKGPSPQQKYIVFSGKEGKALDLNINFFNGYNYTFYAPDNKAMEIAYAKGLPRYEELVAIYEEYGNIDESEYPEEERAAIMAEIAAKKAEVLAKLMSMRAFVRYHFQNNSVFADNVVPAMTYQSLYSSELGIPVNITSQGADGVLTIQDTNPTRAITIDANDSQKLVNKMVRDYEFDTAGGSPTSIAVSSFAVVHQISEPLCFDYDEVKNPEGRYDTAWNNHGTGVAKTLNYARMVNLANNIK